MFDVTCDVTSEIVAELDFHQRVVGQDNAVLWASLVAVAASATAAFGLFVPVYSIEPVAVHAPAVQHRIDRRGRPPSPTVQGRFPSTASSQGGLRQLCFRDVWRPSVDVASLLTTFVFDNGRHRRPRWSLSGSSTTTFLIVAEVARQGVFPHTLSYRRFSGFQTSGGGVKLLVTMVTEKGVGIA